MAFGCCGQAQTVSVLGPLLQPPTQSAPTTAKATDPNQVRVRIDTLLPNIQREEKDAPG